MRSIPKLLLGAAMLLGLLPLAFEIGAARPPAERGEQRRSVRDFGAVCDGTIDDTAALNAAFASSYAIDLPAATCAFKTAPLRINLNFSSLQGAGMWGTSRLLYTGQSTNTDLIQVGSGTTTHTGLTSTGYIAIAGFTVESASRLTGGAAIHQMGTQFIKYDNIALGRQQSGAPTLWNGIFIDQSDRTAVNGFYIGAQNDCIQEAGHGAEEHPATGPQYEYWFTQGKVSGCHIGVHVGGGVDGLYHDAMMVTDVDYDVVIDNGLSPHPNQEVIFGSMFTADFATYDSVLIDDPRCVQRIMCEVSFAGQILHAGAGGTAGVASGSFAGRPAPTNSGNGIHIRTYPGGHVEFSGNYIRDYRNAAVFDEDQTATLAMSSNTIISEVVGSGKGLVATAPWSRVLGFPSFAEGIRAPYVNIANTPVSCGGGSKAAATFTVVNGIVTHC